VNSDVKLHPSSHCRLCQLVTGFPAMESIFSEKELRGLSHNFRIHVSVSDLYIPKIGQPILLQENMWADSGNI
jgi:hypothetical protein